MREQLRRSDPLDDFETLEEARAGLAHLENLRATALPIVLLGLMFGVGITWLDAQMIAWGADPAISRPPFNVIVLTLWTVNAVAAFQFLLLARRCWSLRVAIDGYFDELLAPLEVDPRGGL